LIRETNFTLKKSAGPSPADFYVLNKDFAFRAKIVN